MTPPSEARVPVSVARKPHCFKRLGSAVIAVEHCCHGNVSSGDENVSLIQDRIVDGDATSGESDKVVLAMADSMPVDVKMVTNQ